MKNYFVEVVSEGIGVGNAIVLESYTNVSDNFFGIDEEIKRLDLAINKSIYQLESIKRINPYPNEEFIEVHILLLKDEALKKEIIGKIKEKNINAAIAFNEVINNYIEQIKKARSVYLQERYVDFADIKQRVIRNINNIDTQNIIGDVIIVIDELLPSMIIDCKANIKGIIAKKGGYTSHGVILCKAKEIPYVIIKENDIKNNELIVIDSRKKLVVQNPNEKVIMEYEYLEMNKEIGKPIVNFEHAGIKLYANISNNNEIRKVLSYNFDGIGLYRSEFIFMNLDRPLTMQEQYEIYHEAVLKMKHKPIYFRTFDIGPDKQFNYLEAHHKGFDNYKANPALFESQIKALIKANEYNNMKIMFPMIESHDEFLFLKNWVLQIKEEMKNESNLEIGMMLETRLALENLNSFIDVDFFSLGTNDLTAEIYKISRDESISYHKFIKDLLERLKAVVEFCNENNKQLSICGELASVKNAASMLLKIGIKNYSVSVSSIKTLELAIKEIL